MPNPRGVRTLGWLFLGLWFSACTEPLPEYRLSAVLPSPVTPGDTVTAYGVFPPLARVSLGGVVVETVAVKGGLRLGVPADTVAGMQNLRIEGGGARLEGKVQVLPRIDGAVLEGLTLRVSGAGWPRSGELSGVRISLDALNLSPTLDAAGLSATLPQALPYGPLTLKVRVGEQTSLPYTLVREAGAVRGMVELPAATQIARAQTTPRPEASDHRALVVSHQTGILGGDLPGLVRRQSFGVLGRTITRLSFADEASARGARARLSGLAVVESVEFDARVGVGEVRTSGLASTPSSPGQGQWHLPLLAVPLAWAKTQGEGVTVAVVDSGVLLEHPDLASNLLPGYDFIDNDTRPLDIVGHGTHVAGLIAADGLARGVAPKARLLPVRVLEDLSGGSVYTVAQGILWAAGLLEGSSIPPNPHKALVINLSLGTPQFSPLLADAVARVQQVGVIVVAAAGNSGSGSLDYPAALPGVISVTALAGPLTPYQPAYASHGPGLWLTGYGGDLGQDQDRDGVPDGLLSTDRNPDGTPGYGLKAGTSMASGLVSGLAALALSAGGKADLVSSTLAGTATDLGVMGYDTRFGYGLATARAATPAEPRSYVLALLGEEVVAYTLVQPDGSYLLGNLPPGQPLSLLAATDTNGDGVVGEAGESLSARTPFTSSPHQVSDLAVLTLSPSTGAQPLALPWLNP